MALPPTVEIDDLRRTADDRLQAALRGDRAAAAWIEEAGAGLTLAAAELRLAEDHGFTSWPAMELEVTRRRVLDLHDADALAAFLAEHPGLAARDLAGWIDHPRGISPLAYLAMARFDTVTGTWRDVVGTGAAARVLLAAGAPVDGARDDPETPLVTAASYGDADVAAVLVAAGADVDATAAQHAGGVPGGSALLHAAVFGMTAVVDVLVAAGARIGSIEEAAAAGDISGWLTGGGVGQAELRALVMAADHQRIAVIDALVEAGTPVDAEDEAFGRHPLRLAAANGRAQSVRALLARGADPTARDAAGRTALDHCRLGRSRVAGPSGHDEVASILAAATAS